MPSIWGVAAVVLLVLGWLAGELSGVLVVQHFAVIGLIPATALAFFGPRVMRLLAFPVVYLFFALPLGDVLVPKLGGPKNPLAAALLNGQFIMVDLLGRSLKRIDDPRQTVMMYEAKASGGKRWVLYVDGSVGAIDEKAFNERNK